MNEKKETIEMLKILREQAKGTNMTTQIDQVSIDSFLFVINSAIGVIQEEN